MRLQALIGANDGLGRGPLQEGARLCVHGSSEKVVGGGVADVELDGGIELDHLDEVGGAKSSLLLQRLGLEGLDAQFVDRPQRCDVKADLLSVAGGQ